MVGKGDPGDAEFLFKLSLTNKPLYEATVGRANDAPKTATPPDSLVMFSAFADLDGFGDSKDKFALSRHKIRNSGWLLPLYRRLREYQNRCAEQYGPIFYCSSALFALQFIVSIYAILSGSVETIALCVIGSFLLRKLRVVFWDSVKPDFQREVLNTDLTDTSQKETSFTNYLARVRAARFNVHSPPFTVSNFKQPTSSATTLAHIWNHVTVQVVIALSMFSGSVCMGAAVWFKENSYVFQNPYFTFARLSLFILDIPMLSILCRWYTAGMAFDVTLKYFARVAAVHLDLLQNFPKGIPDREWTKEFGKLATHGARNEFLNSTLEPALPLGGWLYLLPRSLKSLHRRLQWLCSAPRNILLTHLAPVGFGGIMYLALWLYYWLCEKVVGFSTDPWWAFPQYKQFMVTYFVPTLVLLGPYTLILCLGYVWTGLRLTFIWRRVYEKRVWRAELTQPDFVASSTAANLKYA